VIELLENLGNAKRVSPGPLAGREWMKTARHPRYNRPYNECVYQPMLELLAYLRDHGFKTFIVSGGGVEFMRVFAEET
jgi:phosphoserine phosphatase